MSLDVKDLVVEYVTGGYTLRPIDHLNITADPGQLIVLLGPSGSGKTTLLSCLGGILRPTSGRIIIDDTEVTALGERDLEHYRRTKVGFVFQAFNLIPSLSARRTSPSPSCSTARAGVTPSRPPTPCSAASGSPTERGTSRRSSPVASSSASPSPVA